MFEKMIPQDKLIDCFSLLKKCRAAPILGKFPLDDLRYALNCAVTLIEIAGGDFAFHLFEMRLKSCLQQAAQNHETYGEEVDHLANAGTHCCKCPARVTCKARQDYLTNAFNTTDTQ